MLLPRLVAEENKRTLSWNTCCGHRKSGSRWQWLKAAWPRAHKVRGYDFCWNPKLASGLMVGQGGQHYEKRLCSSGRWLVEEEGGMVDGEVRER